MGRTGKGNKSERFRAPCDWEIDEIRYPVEKRCPRPPPIETVYFIEMIMFVAKKIRRSKKCAFLFSPNASQ